MSTRFLHPGLYLFGQLPIRVQTVLGSCVALCAWHPGRRLLAISHAMLPKRPTSVAEWDYRYADQVLSRLLHDMERFGTPASEYRYGLFGGACQLFSGSDSARGVGQQTLAVFRAGLDAMRGTSGYFEDTAGETYRRLVVDGRNGSFRVQPLERFAERIAGASA